MIAASDLICIPYSSELTRAGLHVACQRLPDMQRRPGESAHAWLRQAVMQASAEVILRRHLHRHGVMFQVLPRNPFSRPAEYEVVIAGRRCALLVETITRREEIIQAQTEASRLLGRELTFASERFALEQRCDADLYLFAIVTARIMLRRADAPRAGQTAFWIYAFPERWRRPQRRASLGALAFTTRMTHPPELVLGGLGSERSFQNESLSLRTQAPIVPRQEYFALTYLHAARPPAQEIEISSSRFSRPLVVAPAQWGNIWIYGRQVILLGYLSRREIRLSLLSSRPRLAPFSGNNTDTLSIPVHKLHPLLDLFQDFTPSRVR
ncbi:MAG: hypothetical protein PHS96_07950 [Anaerolineales bacterium]|nr:hypothetical protein [Anaerolineales bacterium]